MANAKKELLEKLEAGRKYIKKPFEVKAAEIRMEFYPTDDPSNAIILREGYTQEEYDEFLEKLDFEYDSGYGLQHLLGTVWFNEPNIWMDRGEYDGSEWWEFNICPEIPGYLRR